MTEQERLLFYAVGIVSMLTGVVLFYKMRGQGNNRVKFLGIEVELSAPSLVIFVFGAGFLMFPFLVAQTPSAVDPAEPFVNVDAPLPMPAVVAHPETFDLMDPELLFDREPEAGVEPATFEPVVGDAVRASPELFWGQMTHRMFQEAFTDEYVASVEMLYSGMTREEFLQLPPQQIADQLTEVLNTEFGGYGLAYQATVSDARVLIQLARSVANDGPAPGYR